MCPALTQHKSEDWNINNSMTGSRDTLKVRDVRLNVYTRKSEVYHKVDPLVTIDESFVSQCMFFKLYANYILQQEIIHRFASNHKNFICENLTTKQATPFACKLTALGIYTGVGMP